MVGQSKGPGARASVRYHRWPRRALWQGGHRWKRTTVPCSLPGHSRPGASPTSPSRAIRRSPCGAPSRHERPHQTRVEEHGEHVRARRHRARLGEEVPKMRAAPWFVRSTLWRRSKTIIGKGSCCVSMRSIACATPGLIRRPFAAPRSAL